MVKERTRETIFEIHLILIETSLTNVSINLMIMKGYSFHAGKINDFV